MENKFVIITAVYNAIYGGRNHIKDCLDSIVSQTFKNYEVVVIDDHSTDGTWEVIQQYPFHKLRNPERNHHGFANIITAMDYLPMHPNDIYVIVDGDDKLAHENVLKRLNEIYQDPAIWFTYGSYGYLSGINVRHCTEVPDTRKYRYEKWWYTSHLKTFRRWLFNAIKDEDLRDASGEYFKVIGDVALTYPMVEMCGKNHMRFVDEILYIYNDLHPNTEFKEKYKEELLNVKNKKPYDEIE